MKKPWKHYAKRRKPETKDHTLYASIEMKWPEEANPQTESTLEAGVGGVEVGVGGSARKIRG